MQAKTDSNTMDSHCRDCSNQDKCRLVWSMPRRGRLTATGLALACFVAFLFPIVIAIVFGSIARVYLSHSPDDTANVSVSFYQVLSVIAGLIVGVILAWLIMPLIGKRFYDHSSRN